MVTASMAGCGLINKEITGTWKASKIEILGKSADFAEYAEEELGQPEDAREWTMEIKWYKKISMDQMGRKEKGTWNKKDDKYVLTVNDSDQEATVEDGKLVIENKGAKVTFEKE